MVNQRWILDWIPDVPAIQWWHPTCRVAGIPCYTGISMFWTETIYIYIDIYVVYKYAQNLVNKIW